MEADVERGAMHQLSLRILDPNLERLLRRAAGIGSLRGHRVIITLRGT